jgi:hypothetical protein
MNYFEARERLDALVRYRRQYVDFIAFTNRDRNVAALTVKSRLLEEQPFVLESLGKVNCGYLKTTDIPSEGGKALKINVVKAVFRDDLVHKYDLRDDTPLDELDRAISLYRNIRWREQLHLWNPLFWIHYFTSYVARLPFRVLESAGYDVAGVEQSAFTRGYVVVMQLICAFVILRHTGILALIWFDFAGR